jgi:hypothetical protein
MQSRRQLKVSELRMRAFRQNPYDDQWASTCIAHRMNEVLRISAATNQSGTSVGPLFAIGRTVLQSAKT